jgi:hypothetical protein
MPEAFDDAHTDRPGQPLGVQIPLGVDQHDRFCPQPPGTNHHVRHGRHVDGVEHCPL